MESTIDPRTKNVIAYAIVTGTLDPVNYAPVEVARFTSKLDAVAGARWRNEQGLNDGINEVMGINELGGYVTVSIGHTMSPSEIHDERTARF